MPLDIPSLPAANQVLRYAKASYDFDRDGGAVGLHSIPSQQAPAGAILFGPTALPTTPLTADDAAVVKVHVGSVELSSFLYSDFNNLASRLDAASGPAPSDGSYPITVEIADFPLTAGAFTIYVWYVL